MTEMDYLIDIKAQITTIEACKHPSLKVLPTFPILNLPLDGITGEKRGSVGPKMKILTLYDSFEQLKWVYTKKCQCKPGMNYKMNKYTK